jgi:G3E family GTPase
VELTNGCGCCTNTSDIASALDSLARDEHCDLIVLEASGASDPAVLAHVVHAHPLFHLDRAVTVVHANALLSDENNVWMNNALRQHLAVADCIIVSGADALSRNDVDCVIKNASHLAPGRTVEMSGLHEPASHVLVPGALRGTHLSMDADEGRHVNTYVTTVSQQNVLTKTDLVQALKDARPGLVRAKGRLILDGTYYLVQVSGHSVDVRETEGGPTSITLISQHEDDLHELRALINRSAS